MIVGINAKAEAISSSIIVRMSVSVGTHDVLTNNKIENKGHIHARQGLRAHIANHTDA